MTIDCRVLFPSLGVVPAIHACLLHGLTRMFHMGFIYLCIMAVTYILGGVAYAIRVPERFFPGKDSERVHQTNSSPIALFVGHFDIIGHSHQILHIAVIAAIYLHFYGICSLFDYVIQSEHCLLPIIFQDRQTTVKFAFEK